MALQKSLETSLEEKAEEEEDEDFQNIGRGNIGKSSMTPK